MDLAKVKSPAVVSFGENLRNFIRYELRMSVRHFAQKSGVSHDTLHRAFKMDSPDELNPSTVTDLAVGAGMTVQQFNARFSSPTPSKKEEKAESAINHNFRVAGAINQLNADELALLESATDLETLASVMREVADLVDERRPKLKFAASKGGHSPPHRGKPKQKPD